MEPKPVPAQPVRIPAGEVTLDGDLAVPYGAGGVVVFVHGSGSSRHSPRNGAVAERLQSGHLATLLFDLLTPEEEEAEARTRHLRFDIDLLAARLAATLDWLAGREDTSGMRAGLFGASTGAGAALRLAARRPEAVAAVVSRGGRPDLAGDALEAVHVPVLLLVGGDDTQVLALNEAAEARLAGSTELRVVPGAGHLFSEPGALEQVAEHAVAWFERHLPPERGQP